MADARQMTLQVRYGDGNQDVSSAVAAKLLECVYLDHAGGESDSLSLSLADGEGYWADVWWALKGSPLEVDFVCKNWFAPGDTVTMAPGKFFIDHVELTGPPEVTTVRGLAVDVSGSLRGEVKTRAWEYLTPQTVAQGLAAEHSLSLALLVDRVIAPAARVEQRQESDLAFLQRLALEHGLRVKAQGSAITLWEGNRVDQGAAVLTVSRSGAFAPLSWAFASRTREVYRSARVSYQDPSTKELLQTTYTPADGPGTGGTLQVNCRAASLAAATQRGADELRGKNEREDEAEIELMGQPDLRAGIVIELSGFGLRDGRWFVDQARHRYSGRAGYVTSARLRRCLAY